MTGFKVVVVLNLALALKSKRAFCPTNLTTTVASPNNKNKKKTKKNPETRELATNKYCRQYPKKKKNRRETTCDSASLLLPNFTELYLKHVFACL